MTDITTAGFINYLHLITILNVTLHRSIFKAVTQGKGLAHMSRVSIEPSAYTSWDIQSHHTYRSKRNYKNFPFLSDLKWSAGTTLKVCQMVPTLILWATGLKGRGIWFLRVVDVLLSYTLCAVISIVTQYEASWAQSILPRCGLDGHVVSQTGYVCLSDASPTAGCFIFCTHFQILVRTV